MGNQHGVQVGQDFGTLKDAALQTEWGNKNCDKHYTSTPPAPAHEHKRKR